MKIEDIKEYLRLEKERRQTGGLTIEELGHELGLGASATGDFVKGEVRAGRLKLAGRRSYKDSIGRTQYINVYALIPHEAP